MSVTLADGTPIAMDKLYTVACWAGTVADEYVTEVLESYEGTWEEVMTEALRQRKTVSPAKDGRFELVWE